MPSRVAIVGSDDFLEPDVKVAESSLPSWLSEAMLRQTFATKAELVGYTPPEGQGLLLNSPDGKSWTITIANDGALTATLNE